MIPTDLIGWLVILVLILSIIGSAVRVLYEYQRGVVFRLGRFAMVKGPGLRFIIPVVDKLVKVSLRTVAMDVPPQDVITKDNVVIIANAVAFINKPIKKEVLDAALQTARKRLGLTEKISSP